MENNLPSTKYMIYLYPEKEPERFLNEFFNVSDINTYLTSIFKKLYLMHPERPTKLIWEPLLKKFLFHEKEEFSNRLEEYILSNISKEMLTNTRSSERIPFQMIDSYISKVVRYIMLFLRNHLIRQADYNSQDEYESAISGGDGYYFLDIACNDLGKGRTYQLSGRLIEFEQDPIEIYGIQNAFLVFEEDNYEKYDFEINKGNYRRLRKKLDKYLGDRIAFTFTVTDVISPNHTQGRITKLV
ncbi:MAG: hypothetical protein IH591_06805 [Bacteroidales bacterium]|nr:hypothetical protein [Bacteroidales bacterium]